MRISPTQGLLQDTPAPQGRIYLVEKKGRGKTIGRFKKLRGAATVKMTTNEIMALTRGKYGKIDMPYKAIK